MKTFKQFEQSYTGTPFGTIHPIADLGSEEEEVKAKLSKSDLDGVEKYADRLYKSVGVDVEFTRHFLDRLNDARNKKQITVAELIRLFKQSYKRYGKKIASLGPDAEAVLNDMQTDINMPFVLKWDGKELDLVAKTVMRKRNFGTSNPKLSFEEYKRIPLLLDPQKLHELITLPDPPRDLQSEVDKIKPIMAKRTSEDEESINNHDENTIYAIQNYCKENGLVFEDGELRHVVRIARPAIGYFKELYNVDRPIEVDSSIKPLVMHSTTNKTRAYPSGHACQAMLVALYASEKYPEHKTNLVKAAKECGLGRIKAGWHYLADYVAGNILAEKLLQYIDKE